MRLIASAFLLFSLIEATLLSLLLVLLELFASVFSVDNICGGVLLVINNDEVVAAVLVFVIAVVIIIFAYLV